MKPGPVRLPRLPAAPLLAECRRQQTTMNALTEALGVGMNNAWRTEGLTWGTADRLACALGRHPGELWGADWWRVETAHRAHRAFRDLRKTFSPQNTHPFATSRADSAAG